MNTLTNEMIEADNLHRTALANLREAMALGGDTDALLAEVNATRIAAANVGHFAHVNTNPIEIVEGRLYMRTSVTPERAAQIMANAARANARG